MIVIHQPSFEEILVVARDLRPEDAKELSITRNLDQPARLAASAWTAKYRRMAYIDDTPTSRGRSGASVRAKPHVSCIP
jgi:hypothetical protein